MRSLIIASFLVAALSSPAASAANIAAIGENQPVGEGSSDSPRLSAASVAETLDEIVDAGSRGGNSAADPCKLLPAGQQCLKVRKCSDTTNPIATIDGYWLANTPAGTYKRPSQHTKTTICYNEGSGIQITEVASDRYPFTPYMACNSYVWQRSAALELMIFPVKTAFDVPRFYFEIDMAPSGATFGSIIFNDKGNTTNCQACKAGELKCSGSSIFPTTGIELHAERDYDSKGVAVGWHTSRFLPFSMFFELKGSTKMFRFNLYRYGYPNGPNGAYELSGYSPTWNPSFHVPSRFGLMVLV